MSERSAIEWCDATWQILSGCSPVNEACRHCYSARLCGTRLKNHSRSRGLVRQAADKRFVFNGEVRFNHELIDWPRSWGGAAEAHAERRRSRIFVADRSDIGYEKVPDEWRDRIFAAEHFNGKHDFLHLTKRWDNLARYFSKTHGTSGVSGRRLKKFGNLIAGLPLQNVWLGWSAHDQESFDAGWAAFKPLAAIGWLTWCSYEPSLGPVDASKALAEGLRWIVAGGESGHGARPLHPDWVRAIRDACRAAGVAFFFKQWGEWAPQLGALDGWTIDDDPEVSRYDHLEWDLERQAWGTPFRPMWCDWDNLDQRHVVSRIGKKKAGAQLDGVEHRAWPVAA
jgi:protein gp37